MHYCAVLKNKTLACTPQKTCYNNTMLSRFTVKHVSIFSVTLIIFTRTHEHNYQQNTSCQQESHITSWTFPWLICNSCKSYIENPVQISNVLHLLENKEGKIQISSLLFRINLKVELIFNNFVFIELVWKPMLWYFDEYLIPQ